MEQNLLINRKPGYLPAILIFIILYAPFIKVGDLTLHIPYYLVLALSAGTIAIYLSSLRNPFKITPFILPAVALGLGSIAFLSTSLVNGRVDSEAVLLITNGTGMALACFCVALYVHRQSRIISTPQSNLFAHAVFSAGAAHASIMILVLLNEPFQNFLYTYIPLNEQGRHFLQSSIRSPGLTSSGGDVLSITQATAFIFGLYYVIAEKIDVLSIRGLKYTVYFLLLLASLMLSARTGFVILLIVAPIALYLSSKTTSLTLVNKTVLSWLSISFVAFTCLLIAAFLILPDTAYSRVYDRFFELIINYQVYGSLHSNSLLALTGRMFFMPLGANDSILFGIGNFGRTEPSLFLQSDIGYLRVLYGSGVIGLIAFYSPFLLAPMILLKETFIKKHPEAIFITITCTIILLSNIKLLYLWDFRDVFKLFLISIYLYYFASSKLASSPGRSSP